MIKKEENTPMKFGIESKTFKDTFEVRKLQEKKDGNFKMTSAVNKTTNKGRNNDLIKGKSKFANNENTNNESNINEQDTNNNEEPMQENQTENYNSNEMNQNQVNAESELNSGDTNSNINTINHQLILAIDVNISEETSEKLEIYKNDDLDEVIEGFCVKHGLDSQKKNYLKTLIEEKLN